MFLTNDSTRPAMGLIRSIVCIVTVAGGVIAPVAPLAEAAEPIRTAEDILAELTQRFRQAPDDRAIHLLMLNEAERLMRTGSPGLAERLFADVASNSGEESLSTRAWRGRYLAAVQQTPDREAELYERMPFAAQRQTQRIVPSRVTPDRVNPDGLPVTTPAVPATTAWPIQSLYTADPILTRYTPAHMHELLSIGDRWVAASPGLIAVFAPGQTTPLWSIRSPQGTQDFTRGHTQTPMGQHLVVPGRFRPTGDKQRLIGRWGIDPASGQTDHLACWRISDGAVLWSTAEDAIWRERQPVGDPAMSDGRVYVLTTQRGFLSLLELAALDAQTGRTLWITPLLRDALELSHTYQNERKVVDLIAYGSGVTAAGGVVYCQTNAGQVIAVDARDGHVQWRHAYDRVAGETHWRQLQRRRGAQPHLTTKRLIAAPRDSLDVLALNPETGALLWRQDHTPAEWIVGDADNALIVAGGSGVAALELASGDLRWRQALGGELICATMDGGARIAGSTRHAVSVLDARTGEKLDLVKLPFTGGAGAMLLTKAGTVALTDEPRGQLPIDTPSGSGTGGSGWVLSRTGPHIHAIAPEGAVLVQSGTVLECIDLAADQRVRWQRLVPRDLRAAVVASSGVALLVFQDTVMGVDMSSGAQQWAVTVPYQGLNDADRPAQLVADVDRHFALLTMHTPHRHDCPVMLVDTRSGQTLWSRPEADPSLKRFSIAGVMWGQEQVLLVGKAIDLPGTVVALSLADGKQQGRETIRDKDGSIVTDTLTRDGDQVIYLDTEQAVVSSRYTEGRLRPGTRTQLPRDFGANPYRGTAVLTAERGLALVEKHRRTTPLQPQWVAVDLERGQVVANGRNELLHLAEGRLWSVKSSSGNVHMQSLEPRQKITTQWAYPPGDKTATAANVLAIRRFGDHLIALTRLTDNSIRVDAWLFESQKPLGTMVLPAQIDDSATGVRGRGQQRKQPEESFPMQHRWSGQYLLLTGNTTIQAFDIVQWAKSRESPQP